MGWEYVVYFLIAAVVGYAMRPHVSLPPQQGPGTAQIPIADEGTPVGVAFGEVWINSPVVLWYGDYEAQAIQVGAGKK
jgi:hypothetical protein